MEFVVLNEEEYRKFYDSNSQSSFMQSVELGHLKKEYGDIVHLVGIKKNKKIVAASLLLESKTILNKSMFYAPRGLIVDYHDFDLLSFFVTELKKYIKNHHGFTLTIDPNVIYRKRSSDGDILGNGDDLSVNNLKKLGFKHFGFNTYLETRQARWAYLLELDEDYETKKSKFSKSTRKNIESTYKKGLQVRVGHIDDLNVMTEIFEITAKRKDFFYRSLDYYKKMYKNMKDLMTIYIAYLNPDVYLEHTKKLLEDEKVKNKEITLKFDKDNVGNKLRNQKKTSDALIEKYEKELKRAENFKEENPKGKDIGCLLSIRSGNEYLTLSSGVLVDYKDFTPKYQMYEKHIEDAYKEGFKYCNFYGITGDFDPKNKYYGVYEFKKGFSGNVIEYIGEFELEVSSFNKIYKLLRKAKGLFKR